MDLLDSIIKVEQMKTEAFLTLFLLVLSSTMFLFAGQGDAEGMEDMGQPYEMIEDYQGTPFIENRGQWDDDVLYASVTDFGHAAITRDGILYNIKNGNGEETGGSVISVTPSGGRITEVVATEETGTYYNFLIGNDPSNWASDVHSYEKIIIRDVWEGIDIEYYMKESSLKYDMVLRPGADPDSIVMEVKGAENIRDDIDNLVIETGNDMGITDGDLIAYYDDNMEEEVEVDFASNSHSYSFDIDGWDRSRTLRIDPVVFSTYIGGIEAERTNGIATDSDGNIYVCGQTRSLIFPTTEGAYSRMFSGNGDGFISKIDPTGSSLLYSTYFGGTSYETLHDVEITPDGGICAVGTTNSIDIPTTENAYNRTKNGEMSDTIILKLDSTGSNLEYSTYLGGTDSETIMTSRTMAIDEMGRIILGGRTDSRDFPLTQDAIDSTFDMMARSQGFVIVMSMTTGDLLYSTYLGGDWSNDVSSLVIDGDENIYIAGGTGSNNFPTTEGAYLEEYPGGFSSLYVMKLNLSLMDPVVYSTYFGGEGFTSIHCIDVDEEGSVYITGKTRDGAFPVTNKSFQKDHRDMDDAFISKINPTGSDLVYSSYYGGSDQDSAFGVKATESGGATVTGLTRSDDIHSLINYTVEKDRDSALHAFIFTIDEKGENCPYQALIGGEDSDEPSELLLASNGDAIVTGSTASTEFPTTEGAYSEEPSGGEDIFVFRMNLTLPPAMVRDLTISQEDGYIHLSWDEPLYDGGLPIDGYKIYRGDLPSVIGEYNQTDGDTLEFSDADVVIGEKYYYMVSAVNGAGEGPRTDMVTTTAVSRPEAPANLRIETGDGYVDLEWNRPYVTGDLLIQSYRIYRDNGSETVLVNETDPLTKKYIDYDVENGIEYDYWMTAVNRIGESDPTDRYDVKPIGLPSSPIDLEAVVQNGTVNLYWAPPQETGGIEIIAYQVLKYLPGGSSLVLEAENRTSISDTLVELGETYTYAVRCLNSLGRSETSDTISVFVSDIPSLPIGLQVNGFDRFVTLKWSVPYSLGGVELSGYSVYRSENDGEFELVAELEANEYFYRDVSVENGNNYTYGVTALNENGESRLSGSDWAIPAGVPSEPTDISVSEVDGGLVVIWGSPDSTNGAPIRYYQVLRSEGDGDMIPIAEMESDEREYRDENVDIATEYTYAVKARNRMGLSRMSEQAVGMVMSIPEPPTDLKATQTERGIELSWRAPSMTGGFEIDYYMVFKWDDSTGTWEEADTVDPGETVYTDVNIEAAKTYKYAVKAHNERGESDLSSDVSITPTGVPEKPLNVKVAETEEGYLKVNWVEPRGNGGEAILHYLVQRSVDSGEFQTVAIVLNTTTSYVDKEVEEGHEYSYRVLAENLRGESDSSEAAIVEIEEEPEGFSLNNIPAGIYIGIIAILLFLVVALSLFTLMKRKKEKEATPVQADMNGMGQDPYGNGYQNGGVAQGAVDPYSQQGYYENYSE